MTVAQELGLGLVILLLATILSVYGWHDAVPGRQNTFFNFDNFIDGIAKPMSYYAIMAVGLTIVIITGGIDISVGSTMALSALGCAAALQTLLPMLRHYRSCRWPFSCRWGSVCSAD